MNNFKLKMKISDLTMFVGMIEQFFKLQFSQIDYLIYYNFKTFQKKCFLKILNHMDCIDKVVTLKININEYYNIKYLINHNIITVNLYNEILIRDFISQMD